MKKVLQEIKARVKDAAVAAYGDQLAAVEPVLDNASNPAFGDFQCNLALTLSKQLKQPPRTIAENIVSRFNADGMVHPPSVAGPGFINIKLKNEFLESEINRVKNDARLGVAKAAPPKQIDIDMSSPNIAKDMHVGHLRSTIIGEALARTFQFLGHRVLKISHVGDWGTQFGMLIAELKEKYPSALTQPDALDIGDLVKFYKQAKKHFDEDPKFQETARLEVVKLQSGDPEATQAWQLLCEQSRKNFAPIYQLLGIDNLVERGESFYNSMLADTVRELQEKGIAREDQGAICIFLEGYTNEEGKPLPLIVQKKDGGYNYATTDLASMRYRVEHDHADELVYVVDIGQSTHFEMVTKAARLAGWVPQRVKVAHVPFGLVLGEDGKKLKTRAGETVKLMDLLEESIVHAREDLDARLNEKGRVESEQWKSSVAKAIGIGAVKYADLSLNRMTNYVFSFKKMLSLQGNTAPYMMYAYVRVQGIAREGGIDLGRLEQSAQVKLEHDTEIDLAKQLLKLDDILQQVVEEFAANRICEYLFDLSQRFNQFYEACPVLNAAEPARTSRLILCNLTAATIRLGMDLLGIPVVERM